MNGKYLMAAFAAAALLPASLLAQDRDLPVPEHVSELGGQGNMIAIASLVIAAIGIFVVLDDEDEPASP